MCVTPASFSVPSVAIPLKLLAAYAKSVPLALAHTLCQYRALRSARVGLRRQMRDTANSKTRNRIPVHLRSRCRSFTHAPMVSASATGVAA
eukprot:3220529-Rhodomonas_salina.3